VTVAVVAAGSSTAVAACHPTKENARGPGHPGIESSHYGNRALATSVPSDGTVTARPHQPGHPTVHRDGSIRTKFPWWIARRSEHPRLRITGRRLDAPGDPLRARVYRSGSRWFHPSLVIFPSTGCWRVTGHTPGGYLSFVVRVVIDSATP
jgi:hypothetical protein